jgi:hypothetical protein
MRKSLVPGSVKLSTRPTAYIHATRRLLMQVLVGAMWGVLGGAVVEAYDTVAVARATRRWPWLDPGKPSKETTQTERWNAFGVWLFAATVRVAAGGGVAAAASSQVIGELAAFGLGVAGPLALERITALGADGSVSARTLTREEKAKAASTIRAESPGDVIDG